MAMAPASMLGWLLDGRFQCTFQGSTKSILAGIIVLDVKHKVLGSMKLNLLETNLGICQSNRIEHSLTLMEKYLDANVKYFQLSR